MSIAFTMTLIIVVIITIVNSLVILLIAGDQKGLSRIVNNKYDLLSRKLNHGVNISLEDRVKKLEEKVRPIIEERNKK